MKKELDNSVKISLIVVGGVLALAIMVMIFYSAQNPGRTISATGNSKISILPDLIGVYFSIQTEALTAKEASDKNSEIADRLRSSMGDLRFDENEIQTESFSVNPKYSYSAGNQKIIGYVAFHSIKIEIPVGEKDKIGETIDAGINAGAGINYINYELTQENQNKYKAEAIRMATEDARLKAEALAEGAGSRLGSLVSVSTSDFGYVPWLAVSEAAVERDSGKAIATQITPSEQDITSSVTATFRIK